MRPQYTLTTPPAVEPVTYDEAAAHLRVDSADDQAYISALISVAREYVDSVTGRVSAVTGWRIIAPSWAALMPCGVDFFPIHRTPLVSVESISYYAPDAVSPTVMDAADYRVITSSEPGLVQILADLPETDPRPDAIKIEFSAGHEESEAPAMLTHAIKILTGHLYDNRAPVAFASVQTLPWSLQAIIDNQKIGGWVG